MTMPRKPNDDDEPRPPGRRGRGAPRGGSGDGGDSGARPPGDSQPPAPDLSAGTGPPGGDTSNEAAKPPGDADRAENRDAGRTDAGRTDADRADADRADAGQADDRSDEGEERTSVREILANLAEQVRDLVSGSDEEARAGPPAGGREPADSDLSQAARGSDLNTPEGDTAMSDTSVTAGTMVPVPAIAFPAPMLFIDLRNRDIAERSRLGNELALLESRKAEEGPAFPPDLQKRIDAIRALLGTGTTNPADGVVDPFFRAVRSALLNSGVGASAFHVGGVFPTQQPPFLSGGNIDPDDVNLNESERTLAAVCGILALDNNARPEVGTRFVGAVSVALGEYAASRDLFDRVLAVVAAEGLQTLSLTPPIPGGVSGTGEPRVRDVRVVDAAQWVEVARSLRNEGVRADDVQLAAKVRARFQGVVGSPDTAAPSVIDIDLPDLEAQADVEIVADNVRALQAVHFSAMLEELRLFQVVDKLVELFQNGLLPFGRGRAGDLLFAYWKKGVDRLSEGERRNIYARAFGMPGGDPTVGNPNREFGDLFLRFASAVSEFVRQFTVEDLLRSTTPFRVSEEHIRKAGRDLAANLSLHGYGIAHYAATEMQTQINDSIAILSDPEVKNAYGARDMWQVIDQVASLELGGARNGIRYRTMATSGAVIIRWLAERAGILAAGYGAPIIDMAQVRRPLPRTPGTKATTHPTDRDLVDAVEQWLAVTGTPDARVEEYSQPVESPNFTSRPIQIPQAARDLLESVGVQAGYGGGGSFGNGGGGYGGGSRFQYR